MRAGGRGRRGGTANRGACTKNDGRMPAKEVPRRGGRAGGPIPFVLYRQQVEGAT